MKILNVLRIFINNLFTTFRGNVYKRTYFVVGSWKHDANHIPLFFAHLHELIACFPTKTPQLHKITFCFIKYSIQNKAFHTLSSSLHSSLEFLSFLDIQTLLCFTTNAQHKCVWRDAHRHLHMQLFEFLTYSDNPDLTVALSTLVKAQVLMCRSKSHDSHMLFLQCS